MPQPFLVYGRLRLQPGYPRLFNPLISVGGSSCYSSRSQCIDFNWAGLVVSVAVMVVVLHEDGLVCAVSGEGNAGDTEAGEDTLETVEATEGAGVSPGLIASPRVLLCPDRPGRSGGLEFLDVETGGVRAGHGERIRWRTGKSRRQWVGERKYKRFDTRVRRFRGTMEGGEQKGAR